jgi:hypothetical protein
VLKKVTKERAFYFFTSIGNYTGHHALSLDEFRGKLTEVSGKSLEFHLHRRDFERWFTDVWGFDQLAEKMRVLTTLNLSGEPLRAGLIDAVSDFLKNREDENEAEATLMDVEEYLRQLPPPPDEHASELKMEQQLRRMFEEREENTA